MGDYIPVNEPLLDGNEKKYISECIDTGWISSEGPYVHKFEAGMTQLTGRKYAIAVSSGTAALEAAVAAIELQPGDEVIIPSFTIISCAAALIRRGCIPVLVDSDATTWNMDVSLIENSITRRTRAIMVVHTYGLPVNMEPVLSVARRYGLKIIEDAAESHGLKYRDKPCGSFGDISVFSFYANKHTTTGEGGMLLTDDEYIAERCVSLRNLCFQKGKRFYHEELGYNFRMTSLQAALGVAQLERLNEFVERKMRMGKLYTDLLSDIPELQLPLKRTEYAENIYWVYGIVLNNEVPFDAEESIRRLGRQDIGTRPFFWPMHEQPVLQRMGFFKGKQYPVAARIARRGFYLPSGLALSDNQIERVCTAVRQIFDDK